MSTDRTTQTARRPSASGLRHGADDEHFAASIMRCQGWPPDCAYHRECIYDDCFSTRAVVRQKIARLEAMIAELKEDMSNG